MENNIKKFEDFQDNLVGELDCKTDICNKVQFYSTGNNITTTIDGKYSSELNPFNFIAKPEFEENTIAIRKTTKGFVVVDVNELRELAKKNLNEKSYSYLDKCINRELLKYNKRKENLTKKKSDTDKETFIRNLSETKHIEKILSDSIDEYKDEYIKRFESSILRYIDIAKEQIEKTSSEYQTRKPTYSLLGLLEYSFLKDRDLYNKIRTYFNKDGSLVHNYKQMVNKAAVEIYDTLKAQYLYKNVYKLGTIVYHKGNLNLIERLDINMSHGEFNGSYKISFNDGSSFVLRSQTVEAHGFIQSYHTRFPSTFHDIVYPSGKKYAKFSEEEMINLFSKNIEK